ncbi:hypothetical protein JCM5296_001308 [Sporobolomyces johnsonii]
MLAKEAGPFLKINFVWMSPELQEAFNKARELTQVEYDKPGTGPSSIAVLHIGNLAVNITKMRINGQEETIWQASEEDSVAEDLYKLCNGRITAIADKFYQSPLISAGAIPSFYIKPEDCRELRPESVDEKYAQIPSTNGFFKVEVNVEPVDNPVDDDDNDNNTTDGRSNSGQGDAMLIDEELGEGEEELASDAAGGRGSDQGVGDTVTIAESGQDEPTIWDPEALFDKLDKVFDADIASLSLRATDVKSFISCVVG